MGHIDVQAAHAAAHTAAIAALAWDCAERHCQRLVEHYVEVYPNWHPITGLQMYTLAELKENNGATADAAKLFIRAKKILSLTHGENHPMVANLASKLEQLD